jgi:pyridoxal phosphate enzyme (YggS family)
MSNIANNLALIKQRIAAACQLCHRQADSVQLLAVSKTKPASDIRAAFDAGQCDFGENYLQEALDKQPLLKDLPINWHFIGPIQSNKTRAIAENFSWVHSVDRAKIARRLSEQRPNHLPPLNICLQVNIDNEASKSGIDLADLPQLLETIKTLPNLIIRGLMAIPSVSNDPEATKMSFLKLAHALKQTSFTDSFDTLSMGMSKDLDIAIEAGATIVRIGTDIFGSRDKTSEPTLG